MNIKDDYMKKIEKLRVDLICSYEEKKFREHVDILKVYVLKMQ